MLSYPVHNLPLRCEITAGQYITVWRIHTNIDDSVTVWLYAKMFVFPGISSPGKGRIKWLETLETIRYSGF